MFLVVRMSARRSNSCCTSTSTPNARRRVEKCANRCARSWQLFLRELNDVPARRPGQYGFSVSGLTKTQSASFAPVATLPLRCNSSSARFGSTGIHFFEYRVFTSSSTSATHDRWIFVLYHARDLEMTVVAERGREGGRPASRLLV